MNKFAKRFCFVALLLIFAQSFMFSNSEEMSLLDLNKEVLSLKYDIYQIENKLGEYKDVSDFSLFFEKAKKNHKLRKYENELKKRNELNKAEAKKAFEQAKKDLEEKGKDLKKLGKDLENAFSDFFNN